MQQAIFCDIGISCLAYGSTLYKWCTVASGTSNRASSVLSYGHLRASTKSRWV